MRRTILVDGESYLLSEKQYGHNERVVCVTNAAHQSALGTQITLSDGHEYTVRKEGPDRFIPTGGDVVGALLWSCESWPSLGWYADCRDVKMPWAAYVADRNAFTGRQWAGKEVAWVNHIDLQRDRPSYLSDDFEWRFGTFAGIGPRRGLPELRAFRQWDPPTDDWDGVMIEADPEVDGTTYWVADSHYLFAGPAQLRELRQFAHGRAHLAAIDAEKAAAEAARTAELDAFKERTLDLLRRCGISSPRFATDDEGRPVLQIGLGGIVALAMAPDELREAIVVQLSADAALSALGAMS